ncbi:hypothetical protein F383_12906 [Gossypium arboreum]|uniref:Uncharacterized protein n=1 Tax=Gossypium arboreum TaxID=29729 RepID=A0A0B0N8W4_GOSAR|nr:hypothetical protein F383_12906 [Gossypium arboreum]
METTKTKFLGEGVFTEKRDAKYVPLHPLFIVLENLVYS